MFFIEKRFASVFIPALYKGDRDFLAAMPGVEIFEHMDQIDREKKNVHISNGIATISIFGVLGDDLPWWMSHTSYVSIIEGIRIADADESVEKIILEVDSPGGFVSGWMPAALAIKNSVKPVTAIVGNMAASAAYMLASQADDIIARDNLTTLGSIGVASEHMDFTRFFEEMGIDVHTFTNAESKDKRPDLNTAEGRAVIQKEIDDIYHEIEILLADGRGVTIDFLRENFGEGRVMLAKEALSAKMVDEIKQKDLLLNESSSGSDEIKQEIEQMEKINTVADFKAHNLSLYDSICADSRKQGETEGFGAGNTAEKERVNKWASFIDVEQEACIAGIKEGTELDSVTMARYAAKQVHNNALADMSKENGDDKGETVETGEIKDDETDPKAKADADFAAALDAECAKTK